MLRAPCGFVLWTVTAQGNGSMSEDFWEGCCAKRHIPPGVYVCPFLAADKGK